MWFGHGVIHTTPFSFGSQEAAALHQAEMLRGHVAGDSTGFSQLSDGESIVQQHLNHPQPVRVRKRPQTLGRFGEGVQIS